MNSNYLSGYLFKTNLNEFQSKMLRRMEVPEPVSEPVSPLEVDKE